MDEVPKIASDLFRYIDFNQQSLWSEPPLDAIMKQSDPLLT